MDPFQYVLMSLEIYILAQKAYNEVLAAYGGQFTEEQRAQIFARLASRPAEMEAARALMFPPTPPAPEEIGK